jgi:hypothetical protein
MSNSKKKEDIRLVATFPLKYLHQKPEGCVSGILLYGCTGVGKSMIINAILTESRKASLFKITAADICKPYFGMYLFSCEHILSLPVAQVFLCCAVAHFMPYCGSFCAFPWHISLFVPCCGTFCAVLWHILYRPVAQSIKKSLFVQCYGTFCAFPWHISLKVFLCHAVAHFVTSCGT